MRKIILSLSLTLLALNMNAQYTKLFDFPIDIPGNKPHGDLITDGTWFYGVTSLGGAYNDGIIFKVKADGTNYTKLADFDDTIHGKNPLGSLTLSGDTLFGMAQYGGINDQGVIFRINTDGSSFTKLADFDYYTYGGEPSGSLILSGNKLYGMTFYGGINYSGVIFKINTNGSGFDTIRNFDGTHGSNPNGTLSLLNDTLYGMTSYGGKNDYGAIFKININGSGLDTLRSFDGTAHGGRPYGSLTLSGSTLYGMTDYGGTNNVGAIFKIFTDGSGFYKLANFDGTAHGSNPIGSLILSGSTLYGMTYYGGTNDLGVVFKINSNGSSFTKLADFDDTTGSNPQGSLLLSGSTLYGMTEYGGTNYVGVVFKVNTSGGTITKLTDFNKVVHDDEPSSSPTLSGSTLYGMTKYGGSKNYGIIFKINTNGSGFDTLLNFDGITHGSYPNGSLTILGSTLFGMTYSGGAKDSGIVFKINTNGSGFTKLHDFSNTDGVYPHGSLILSGSSLYGMTYSGGAHDYGTIFKIDTGGTGFIKLADFDGSLHGSYPYGSLVLSGNTLYGLASNGGDANDDGTIFKINTDGSSFTKLKNFDGTAHGANPYGSIVLSGNTLYGMTYNGGTHYDGTIFKINIDGSGFTKLADFDGIFHGSGPYGSITLSGNTLYGMTNNGGINNDGVIFKINADGTSFTKLVDFDGLSRGSYPGSDLAGKLDDFYGLLNSGGADGMGVIFHYHVPLAQATNITTGLSSRYATIGCTKGSGLKRIVFVKQTGTGTISPVNGTAYTANSVFGKGSQLGTDWYCAYNGTGYTTLVKLTGLSPVTSYRVKVCEYVGDTVDLNYYLPDTTGNPFTFTTPKDSQQITFTLPAKTYGYPDFAPGAVSNKGLAITYASSDTSIASIVGNNIHIKTAGMVNITASQAGNDTVFATNNIQKLIIKKAILTITPDNKNRVIGWPIPDLTFTYSGFVYGENSSVLTLQPILYTNATNSSPIGTYYIKVQDTASTNYYFKYTNGTFTISVDPIQICLVTVDWVTGKFMIIWEPKKGFGISKYKVYREDTSATHNTFIDSVLFNSPGILVDPTSDAQSQTYRYKLSAVDSSGNESLVGNYHQPMRLSTDKQSDNIHLTWTPYLVENGSITFDSYKIYKSTDSANLKLAPVVTISSHLPDYNDTASTSLKFKTFYRIAGVLIDTCDPNASKYLKGGSDIYSQSVSNLEDNRLRSSNISAMSDKEFDLRIYPNPCSSFVTISYHLNATSDVKIVIINLMGKEVSSLINTKKQPAGEYYIRLNATEFDKNSGVYLLKLEAGNDITMKKLVVVK